MAVCVFRGPGSFGDEGWVELYLNDGAGGLPSTPSWMSADRFYGFGLALGDADSDGDLDLAFGGAGAPHRVYYPAEGSLSLTSS